MSMFMSPHVHVSECPCIACHVHVLHVISGGFRIFRKGGGGGGGGHIDTGLWPKIKENINLVPVHQI